MITPPQNHFAREKPFYPLVLNFIATLHGWSNLFARGVGRLVLVATDGDDPAARATPNRLGASETGVTVPLDELRDAARLPAVIAPLELGARTQSSGVPIDHDEMADEAVSEYPTLLPWSVQAGATGQGSC